MAHLTTGTAYLTDLSLVEVSGADAGDFLQNQLSQDILALSDHNASFASYCNYKGRILASFVVLKVQPDCYWLIVAADLIPSIIKKLQMYVLRSKVSIRDISQQHSILGCIGADLPDNLTLAAPWSRVSSENYHAISLYPAQQQARAILISRAAPQVNPNHSLSLDAWHYGEVLSGVVLINSSTATEYVPQMLNYESIGGVNFSKGCYPGQEIIARSQFRGSVKRRAFIVTAAAAIAAKADVFYSEQPDAPCGAVVQSASYASAHAALVCLKVSAASSCQAQANYLFCLDENQQQLKLTLLPLPYPLLTDL